MERDSIMVVSTYIGARLPEVIYYLKKALQEEPYDYNLRETELNEITDELSALTDTTVELLAAVRGEPSSLEG